MQRHLEGSDYFSDEEMKRRCPDLYEQFVGQYLTDAELHAQTERYGTLPWSTHLLDQIDKQQTR